MLHRCYDLDVSPEFMCWELYNQCGSGKRNLPALSGLVLLLREWTLIKVSPPFPSLSQLSLYEDLWLYYGELRRPLADTVPPSWIVQPTKS